MDVRKHTTLVQTGLRLEVRNCLSSLGDLKRDNINAIKYNITYKYTCIYIYMNLL